MKVTHIVTELNYGGVERHMEVIAKASLSNKEHISFISLSKGGVSADRIRKLGFRVDVLEMSPKIPNLKLIYRLIKLLRKQRPQVVHCHGGEANFHGIWSSFFARVPVRIAEEIGIPSHSKIAIVVFKFTYFLASGLIAVSKVVRDWLISSGEINEYNLKLIINPVEIPKTLERNNLHVKKIRIGYMGRLEVVKNPIMLLESFCRIKKEFNNVELVYIGEGSERNRLEQYIKSNGLEDSVSLLGFQEEPHKYVQSCDFMVMPSLSEGFSLGLIELMGCAKPVITTNVGGAEDIIEESENGFLLHEISSACLLEKLKLVLLLNKIEYERIGLKARESVLDKCDPNIYINCLNSYYNTLLINK